MSWLSEKLLVQSWEPYLAYPCIVTTSFRVEPARGLVIFKTWQKESVLPGGLGPLAADEICTLANVATNASDATITIIVSIFFASAVDLPLQPSSNMCSNFFIIWDQYILSILVNIKLVKCSWNLLQECETTNVWYYYSETSIPSIVQEVEVILCLG